MTPRQNVGYKAQEQKLSEAIFKRQLSTSKLKWKKRTHVKLQIVAWGFCKAAQL